MEGVGFEPTNSKRAVLQTAAINRSATPPNHPESEPRLGLRRTLISELKSGVLPLDEPRKNGKNWRTGRIRTCAVYPLSRRAPRPLGTCPLAEGEGFEPPRSLQAYPLSRRAHSTVLCHPSILVQPDFGADGEIRTRNGNTRPGLGRLRLPIPPRPPATSASAFPASRRVRKDRESGWSEWQDSNLRPPRPKLGALPGCATLRLSEPIGRAVRVCRFSPRDA